MQIEQNENFQEMYRELIEKAEKEGPIKFGVGDKLLVKKCLEEVYLDVNLGQQNKKDLVIETLSTYLKKYH
ncbi:MAG: hypothetical protein KKF48_01955 [Nanoarchaeota archaeon]|nr:hypothetical protein [Nanoarchaeota archaeon]MBU1027784.1 hypothetical protein [Nanoarchaeota archaeon]